MAVELVNHSIMLVSSSAASGEASSTMSATFSRPGIRREPGEAIRRATERLVRRKAARLGRLG